MALNAALSANPIGLVVIAIAALVAGLIYAYQHSATFRAIVQGAMKAVVLRSVGCGITLPSLPCTRWEPPGNGW